MKSLCITGSVQSTLDQFAQVLLKAGAKAALPALRNEKMSITQWHQKALARQSDSTSAALTPDRKWDRPAIDIFNANDNHPLWLWADENSIQVLDYWLKFDASTLFVLVHTSPHLALVAALEDGNNTLLALETVLQQWFSRTQAMLNFHLRHPNRSVFIESLQASSEPGIHVQALAKHWQLPLQPTEISSAYTAAEQYLELYIATNLLQRHPHAAELHNEVRARLLITSAPNTVGTSPVLDQVLADLLVKRRDLLSAHAANQELEQRLHANVQASRQAEHENQNALKKLHKAQSKLEQEKLALQSQLQELTLEHRRQQDTIEQVQNEISVENELLLHQLHYTQEELEQRLIADQSRQTELEQSRTRLQKMLHRFPDYWDVEDIQLHRINNKEQHIVQWNLKNVYLDNHFVPTLDLQTRLENGIAGVFIQRSADSKIGEDWLRWPRGFEDATELPCMPSPGAASFGNNAVLSGLSTRDWEHLQLLIKHLIVYLDSPAALNLAAEIERHTLLNGLNRLQATLVKWPLMFRYDDAQLIDNQQDGAYQALGIRLNNLSLGANRWSSIEYRLATSDQGAASFGQNPRLEFHECSRNTLQNWFAESHDSRGPKLELRFAKPDALDTKVWGALSETDRLLIAGLVSGLPAQLTSLQQANPALPLQWQDWHALSTTVKKILAKNSMNAQGRKTK
jgi:hypothetical protein